MITLTYETKAAIKYGTIFQLRRLLQSSPSTPRFLIIGAMKCATTSLYDYICQHPAVSHAFVKEVHFFDFYANYSRGVEWYQNHFASSQNSVINRGNKDVFSGEASPYYIFHPHTAQRVAQHFPDIKLILVLRDPVKRAYSHYAHESRIGHEHLATFREAVLQECDRLAQDVETMRRDETYDSWNHSHFSYVSRGLYIQQINRWLKYFSKEQLLILSTTELGKAPRETYQKATQFLELEPWEPEQFHEKNTLKGGKTERGGRIVQEKIDPEVQEALTAFYTPHNQALYELVGTDFGWSRSQSELPSNFQALKQLEQWV